MFNTFCYPHRVRARVAVPCKTSSDCHYRSLFSSMLAPSIRSSVLKTWALGLLPKWDLSSLKKNLSPAVNAALSKNDSQRSAPAPHTKLGVTPFQGKLFTLQRAGGGPFPCPRHHAKWWVLCWKPLPFLSGPIPVPQHGLTGAVL